MPPSRSRAIDGPASAASTAEDTGHTLWAMAPTIYEAMGGEKAVLALAAAWHERCLADPIVSHPFEGGVHPQHTERLAAYWAEQLGGPDTYTKEVADHSHAVRLHSGNGPHEQMDGRAVACFVLALDDAGIPNDPELRFNLVAWFTWATALLNHRWDKADEVPDSLPFPQWDWSGTEGW
jgi:truncated hemoglobin YjbI